MLQDHMNQEDDEDSCPPKFRKTVGESQKISGNSAASVLPLTKMNPFCSKKIIFRIIFVHF